MTTRSKPPLRITRRGYVVMWALIILASLAYAYATRDLVWVRG